VADADGSNPVAVTAFESADLRRVAWSVDSRFLAASAITGGKESLWVIPAGGGAARKLVEIEAGSFGLGWSSNHEVIFQDRGSIRKMAISGGGPAVELRSNATLISTDYDGIRFYYIQAGQVFGAPISGGSPKLLGQAQPGMQNPASRGVLSANEGVYYVDGATAGKAGKLMFWRFPASPSVEVATAERPSQYGLSLSPAGDKLLFSEMVSSAADILLVKGVQ